MEINKKTIAKLTAYQTATIRDVVEMFNIVPPDAGLINGRVKALAPELPPMVGFACTALIRTGGPPTGMTPEETVQRQLELFATLPGPAVVVFQDLDDPPAAATFGEVMSSLYQAFGSAGLITSGAGRDLAEVRDLHYPVFCSAASCSAGYWRCLGLGVPVRVGGMEICQGDLLHGDGDGITIIPQEIAAAVADLAPQYVAAEARQIEYARAPGEKTVAEFAGINGKVSQAMNRLKEKAAEVMARISKGPA